LLRGKLYAALLSFNSYRASAIVGCRLHHRYGNGYATIHYPAVNHRDIITHSITGSNPAILYG